ncbi:MAG: tRNA lysidine(34) synthetase TilS, partial [Pseudomonadota bacterium]
MIQRGDRLVLAVSGGPDSVAMTHMMAQLMEEFSLELAIASLDHSIREESSSDLDFVRKLAKDLGIEFHGKKIDVPQLASQTKISLEQAGRIARYRFLEEIRIAAGAHKIATAHNSDDVIETFLLRVFQGSSLTGLSSIPVIRGNIIRPMLKVNRSEIIQFLASENIRYRLDKTNLSLDTDRNCIRNCVIPAVVQRFPKFREPTLRTIDLVQEDAQYLRSVAHEAHTKVISEYENRIEIDVRKINSFPQAISSRIVKSVLFALSPPDSRWTSLHVRSVVNHLRSAKPATILKLPNGLYFIKDYEKATISKFYDETRIKYSLIVNEPCRIKIPEAGMSLLFSALNNFPVEDDLKRDSQRACYNLDSIKFPFLIRPFEPGDRIIPWGRKRPVKIKKLFIDSKTPRAVRSRLPLVINDGEIIWIP